MAKNIKDLGKYLDKKTGLNSDEREQWRNDLAEIRKKTDNEKDQEKKAELRRKFMAYFTNMNLWKSDKQAGKV